MNEQGEVVVRTMSEAVLNESSASTGMPDFSVPLSAIMKFDDQILEGYVVVCIDFKVEADKIARRGDSFLFETNDHVFTYDKLIVNDATGSEIDAHVIIKVTTGFTFTTQPSVYASCLDTKSFRMFTSQLYCKGRRNQSDIAMGYSH